MRPWSVVTGESALLLSVIRMILSFYPTYFADWLAERTKCSGTYTRIEGSTWTIGQRLNEPLMLLITHVSFLVIDFIESKISHTTLPLVGELSNHTIQCTAVRYVPYKQLFKRTDRWLAHGRPPILPSFCLCVFFLSFFLPASFGSAHLHTY